MTRRERPPCVSPRQPMSCKPSFPLPLPSSSSSFDFSPLSSLTLTSSSPYSFLSLTVFPPLFLHLTFVYSLFLPMTFLLLMWVLILPMPFSPYPLRDYSVLSLSFFPTSHQPHPFPLLFSLLILSPSLDFLTLLSSLCSISFLPYHSPSLFQLFGNFSTLQPSSLTSCTQSSKYGHISNNNNKVCTAA